MRVRSPPRPLLFAAASNDTLIQQPLAASTLAAIIFAFWIGSTAASLRPVKFACRLIETIGCMHFCYLWECLPIHLFVCPQIELVLTDADSGRLLDTRKVRRRLDAAKAYRHLFTKWLAPTMRLVIS